MERETSSLLIKSNRVLGTRLVDAGLTSLEDMEKANESFISHARAKDLSRASLLRILIYDDQTLAESDLLDYQIENHKVGAIMLDNYHLDDGLLAQHPLELMRASWTVPMDHVNERWFMVTAYYLSDIVRNFWEERLPGRVSWYISTMHQLESCFEKIEEAAKEEENNGQAAPTKA